MCINVFPNSGSTYIIFSYLKQNASFSKFKEFLDNLECEIEVEKYLSKFLVMNVGNIVFSKRYMEKIGTEKKEKNCKRFYRLDTSRFKL